MRAATVVQVLQDLFYVLLQLLVVDTIILSFKFYCKFYCMFYFTCDRSLTVAVGLGPPGHRRRLNGSILGATPSRRRRLPLISSRTVGRQPTISDGQKLTKSC